MSNAQPLNRKPEFSRADSLRGSITPGRAWWDVKEYDLTVWFDFSKRSLTGSNTITYTVVSAPTTEMQIDLQVGLNIDSVIYEGGPMSFWRDGNVYFVKVPPGQAVDDVRKVTVYYSGIPRPAIRPPWDGGVIWSKDAGGNPWISVACQGLGASVWFPCKDHQSDEPDHTLLSIITPDSLVAVGNGRLKTTTSNGNGTTTYTWEVVNPINNYNIIPYIGKYAHWQETYAGEKGNLDCDYWVLDYNLEKAKTQFKQASEMLQCFEHWFGPYPFYEDGFKLVESPHLGMEHQSAIAYGNRFANGYLGNDLSETGWGLKWDFILVHESGHEWFGNNITTKDVADMWVHESFTNYSETLFTTCKFGKEAGNDYVIGTRKRIQNDIPVQGPFGVNQEGSGDMYYKGGNLVHIIRQVINNDSLFRSVLRGLNRDFYHQTITGKDLEVYISRAAGIDFSKVFDQYLRTTQIPVLEYKIKGKTLNYRWNNVVNDFDMPIRVNFYGEHWLKPAEKWQTLKPKNGGKENFSIDRNFYVETLKVD
ncbi:MAG: M1 family metallopeptidase [Chitinophagaceae bacterium]|nr:M1 family metallopeptidase [Chitinophagaceae bacterium]MCW5929380.1 M1 family metallopeptidase [Chitinophagaceae bacterium]